VEFWHILSIAICGALLAFAFIMGWFWLAGIALIAIPIAAIWGFVATGPGSSHNPYPQH
jgi:hypothetical protein